MADSYHEFVGNGSTKTFTISFPYIDRSHIKVYVNNTPMLRPSDWDFSGPNQIVFVIAPATDMLVKIQRDTPLGSRLVDFQPGAVLTEADLDLAHTQHHYNIQELSDNYDSLLDGAKTRLAGANGIAITEAEELIDNMVAEVLASDLASTLQQAINDIDANAESVLDVDTRMIDLEAIVDSLTDIDGTGIVTFIENEQAERIAGDAALASDIALIGAANGADTAFILNSSTVKLDSDVGDTIAQKFTAIQSDIDGNTATVLTQASAINGLEAEYTVKVDVNGKVAGFGLATSETASQFIIAADRFSVIDPADTDTGTAVVPFVVSGGNVYMQNVIIQNALIESIDAGKISSGLISTSRLNIDGITLTNDGGELKVDGVDWTTHISGANKPEDNATVGATVGTNLTYVYSDPGGGVTITDQEELGTAVVNHLYTISNGYQKIGTGFTIDATGSVALAVRWLNSGAFGATVNVQVRRDSNGTTVATGSLTSAGNGSYTWVRAVGFNLDEGGETYQIWIDRGTIAGNISITNIALYSTTLPFRAAPVAV